MTDSLVIKVADWICQGIGLIEIREKIRDRDILSPYTNAEYDQLYWQAKKMLEEMISPRINNDTISIHVSWYEQVYQYYESISHTSGILKAMRCKEKVLGLSGTGSKVIINKKTEINIKRDIKYDTDQLTSHEKLRLQVLLERAKPTRPPQNAEPAQISTIIVNAVHGALKLPAAKIA